MPGVRTFAGLAALAGAVTVSACGGGSSQPAAGGATHTPIASPTSEVSPAEPASVVKAGFGQQDQFLWVTALVRNNTADAGQTVVVSFNVKGPGGKVIATGSQTSGFNWAHQEVPIGTQVEVPKHTKVTAVAPTVSVEDQGIVTTSKDYGSFKGEIVKDQYGAWSATFHVRNPTSKLLKNIALMSICTDQKGRVIGGGNDFPDLIPPGGEIVVKPLTLYLTQRPVSCTGYLTPWF